MKNISKYLKIFLIVLFSTITFNVNAIEVVTIKELKENIKQLQEKQGEVSKQIASDLGDIGDIQKFLKDNLTEKEYEEIKTSIFNYRISKEKINTNNDNQEKTKNLLLELKKETYKKLIPYIEPTSLDDYLAYIKNNIETLKHGKKIDDEIYKNKELLEQKVILIKEKIKTHENELKNEIDELINKKIDEKIDLIKNNEKFKILDLEKRKSLIERTIVKISIKSKNLESNPENEKKVNIYDIVIKKLGNVLNELK